MNELLKEKIKNIIDQLETEADAFEEIGSIFSATSIREEAKRLRKIIRSKFNDRY